VKDSDVLHFQSESQEEREGYMLRLALLFFIIALIAGFFGFPLTGAVMWEAGKIFFFVFIVLAVLALLGGAFYGRSPPV
jgi:uncharacterized membrane protein YtjA (UPF0391 family)